MIRRVFLTLLGGAAAVWPLAARAQQEERVRRVGVLMNLASDDPEGRSRLAAFRDELTNLGWTIGPKVLIDERSSAGNIDRLRQNAAELLALPSDVIFTGGNAAMGVLRQATRAVPIVFIMVTDPVGAGFVESLARPGGNATGFTTFEFSTTAKELELLKEIAPKVKRVAVIRDAAAAAGLGHWSAIQAVAPSFGVELTPLDPRDRGEIERGLVAFVRGANDGLIVTLSTLAAVHRDLIVALVARHRLPTVYPVRYFVTGGGLISYGSNTIDPARRAASYVARILKGEKPADLPVQAPVKYELVINLKTAKALGLAVPPSLLVRADEVIE